MKEDTYIEAHNIQCDIEHTEEALSTLDSMEGLLKQGKVSDAFKEMEDFFRFGMEKELLNGVVKVLRKEFEKRKKNLKEQFESL